MILADSLYLSSNNPFLKFGKALLMYVDGRQSPLLSREDLVPVNPFFRLKEGELPEQVDFEIRSTKQKENGGPESCNNFEISRSLDLKSPCLNKAKSNETQICNQIFCDSPSRSDRNVRRERSSSGSAAQKEVSSPRGKSGCFSMFIVNTTIPAQLLSRLRLKFVDSKCRHWIHLLSSNHPGDRGVFLLKYCLPRDVRERAFSFDFSPERLTGTVCVRFFLRSL